MHFWDYCNCTDIRHIHLVLNLLAHWLIVCKKSHNFPPKLGWSWVMRHSYRSRQATPLMPADAVWRGEGGHRGSHWDRDGHLVSLPTRGAVALLFVFEPQTKTHTHMKNVQFVLFAHNKMRLHDPPLSHLGAGLWDWAERFCVAPPDMVVGYKGETRYVAGAMEPDSEATACALFPGLTPLRWERRDRQRMFKGISMTEIHF